MMKKSLFLLNLMLLSQFYFSQTTPVIYTVSPTINQINSSLTGPNIAITGGEIKFGKTTQIATFTQGFGANLEMEKGVYFSTGSVVADLTKNTYGATNSEPANGVLYSDPDLLQIDSGAKHDVVSYEFSITLANNVTGVNIAYQFGSEEYPNYVGSIYNDAFGFFIKGPGIIGSENLAKLPNGKGTSINTVNAGVRGQESQNAFSPSYDGSQSAIYINNGHSTNTYNSDGVTYYYSNQEPQPGPFPVNVQHNGLTKLINYSIRNLQAGGTYTFKIIIADSNDGIMDSGVFVKDISGFADIYAVDDSFTVNQGNSTTTSILLNDNINGSIPTELNTNISSTNLPNGFTINLDGTVSISDTVIAGSYTFNYTICEKSNPIYCKTAKVTIVVLAPSFCYKNAEVDGVILPSQHGITSLGRAGADQDNWPMVRKGAHTVLESKTKGFVINRLTTNQKNALTPSLGMIVFDTDLDCLSIYDDSSWKCYNVQTCPN